MLIQHLVIGDENNSESKSLSIHKHLFTFRMTITECVDLFTSNSSVNQQCRALLSAPPFRVTCVMAPLDSRPQN